MSKKVKIIGIALLAVLSIIFLVRSCTAWFTHHERIYRIARDPTWYPLDLMGKERNMLAFMNDLLSDIAMEQHVQFNLFSASRDDLFSGLSRGEYDAIVTSIDPTPMLEDKYVFSDPFYLTGPVIIVQKESDIRSFEDLGGEMVGIKSGSPIVFRIRDYPTILFRTYGNIREALDHLVDNEIDAVIMDSLPAYANTESFYTEKLKIVGGPLTDEGLRLVAKKDAGAIAMLGQFDEGLKEMIKNGTYQALIQKWGLIDSLGWANSEKAKKGHQS